MTARILQPAGAARADNATRWFGHFQLLRLLGKSARTTAWRAEDSRNAQELMLVLPRAQLAGLAARERWLAAMQRGARLNHPQLATPLEVGVHESWPFATYDFADSATLGERLPAKGMPGVDAASCLIQALQGLAFSHDAGLAHHDLQLHQFLVTDHGQVRLAGLGVASEMGLQSDAGRTGGAVESGSNPESLKTQRDAAERDVLACGILLHQLLTGQAVLEEPDIGRVIDRLPPAGRETMRLPFAIAHPVAEPLRAIANRATDRQPRQRYRSARTLLQALEGWRASEGDATGGTLAQLAERVRHGGVMPASPGASARATRLASMARERISELAEVVLEDPGLSFELLRMVNAAQVRGSRIGGADPVLTVRRAIALLGMDGVRRAASSMRDWPGALGNADGAAAAELQRLVERCKRAGRVAMALRPAGYDGEVVYLIALLQNLGRMLINYHFADEALQIRRLMQPAPPTRAGDPEDPGMSEEGAAFAVLGIDLEALGMSVARQWGLDESALSMLRRLPQAAVVHAGGGDYEMLRVVAGCANEAVDALALPAPRVAPALQRVLTRFGRQLSIGPRDLHAALQGQVAPAAVDAAGARTLR